MRRYLSWLSLLLAVVMVSSACMRPVHFSATIPVGNGEEIEHAEPPDESQTHVEREHGQVMDYTSTARAKCPGPDDDAAVIDCRLHVEVDYSPQIEALTKALEDQCPENSSDAEVINCRANAELDYEEILHQLQTKGSALEASIELSRTVMQSAVDRLDYEAANPGHEIDKTRLAGVDKNAFEFFDVVRQMMWPRLVVVASDINVHADHDVNSDVEFTLPINTVVWWCGGLKARTKPDKVKVDWYRIDLHGDCESGGKYWVASREVQDGKEHRLINWLDYEMDWARAKKAKAAQENDLPSKLRYAKRTRRAQDKDRLILARSIGMIIFEAFAACFIGVGCKKLIPGKIYRQMRKFVKKNAGGIQDRDIAKMLAGVVSHSLSTQVGRSTPANVLLGCILIGTLVASIDKGLAPLILGVLVCADGVLLYHLVLDFLRSRGASEEWEGQG